MLDNNITLSQKRRIFLLLKTLNMTDERALIIPQFTNDRTDSLTNMSVKEAQDMISFLELKAREKEPIDNWITGKVGLEFPTTRHDENTTTEALDYLVFEKYESTLKPQKPTFNNDEKAVKMRKKVLHLLGLYGMTTEGGKLDYQRIDDFVMNIGSRNPNNSKLNFLTNQELVSIITQIEQMVYKPKKKSKNER